MSKNSPGPGFEFFFRALASRKTSVRRQHYCYLHRLEADWVGTQIRLEEPCRLIAMRNIVPQSSQVPRVERAGLLQQIGAAPVSVLHLHGASPEESEAAM